MTPEQLKALANTPGYGSADEALRSAGHYKEHDDRERPFTVTVEYSIGYTATLDVNALNESDARKAARDAIHRNAGVGVEECLEIYTVKVEA